MTETMQVRDLEVAVRTVRTAIYARISKDRTGLEAGVQRQIEDSLELCQRLGLTVVATFMDNDISAYSGKRRPRFEEMVTRLQNGEFDAIVCYHVNRLYRQTKDLERLIHIIGEKAESGIQIYTVKSSDLDLSTSSGRMVARITGAIAQGQSEESSERIQRASLERAKKGLPHGPRPFGYNNDGTLHETEAPELRSAARKLINGEANLYSLAKDLNERNFPTSQGKRWRQNTLMRCLVNPRNAGLRVHQGQILDGVEVVWEPLWDREMYDTLVRKLDRGNPNGAGRKGGPVPQYLGTGLYVCGVCNQPKMSRGAEHKVPVYRCTSRNVPGGNHVGRNADKLDDHVTKELLRYLTRHGFVDEMINMVHGDDAKTKDLVAERERIERAIEALQDDDDDDLEAIKLFKARIKKKTARIAEINTELESLGRRSSLEALKTRMREYHEPIATALERLPISIKRAILAETFTVMVMPLPKRSPKFQPCIELRETKETKEVIRRLGPAYGHGDLAGNVLRHKEHTEAEWTYPDAAAEETPEHKPNSAEDGPWLADELPPPPPGLFKRVASMIEPVINEMAREE